MAERIVSPGVFTQERDLSFLPEGIAQIGAAFVGPFAKGPAFIPTAVEGLNEFVSTFGQPDATSYAGYAVNNYLQEAGSATVVRVLGWTDGATKGYTADVANVYVTGSAGKFLLATLHPNVSVGNIDDVSVVSLGTSGQDSASFYLTVSGSGSAPDTVVTASVFEASSSFIGKIYGTVPVSSATLKHSAYTYAVFPSAYDLAATTRSIAVEIESLSLATNFSHASTPFIQSQLIGGEVYNLFKLHTLSDGTSANKEVKLSITGVSPSNNPDSDFGSFSILVRSLDDIDNNLNVLEEWSNLSMDPASSNYIARRIGNSVPDSTSNTYEGDFQNNSSYIRVELADTIIPNEAVPYGFDKLTVTIPSGSGTLVAPEFVETRIVDGVDKKSFYGYDYTITDNLSYLAPTISSASFGSAFNISNITTDEVNGTDEISLDEPTHVGYRRFTVPLQGGFDGFSPARKINMGVEIIGSNTQGFDLSSKNTSGSAAYLRALNTLANSDSVDLNMLVVPGVLYNSHRSIAQQGIDICEARQDCFYIMDAIEATASISNIVSLVRDDLNTNYAATYYPWVRIADANTGMNMWAPPSVVLPEVFAYNDSVGAEWFAPAGLNRGGVSGAIGVKTRLSQADRDTLYEGRVNPIAQFPAQGISVWGQKTLQRRASALDRINVRRLLITVKKFIASSARFLVFEQNTEATRNRFLNIVNPYLAGIQQRSGLTSFRVVMDESNNTPDIIDRNILVGAIYLQPTRTAEFIKLDFNILPTGASFDTV
jgi:hypothetical protein